MFEGSSPRTIEQVISKLIGCHLSTKLCNWAAPSGDHQREEVTKDLSMKKRQVDSS